MLIGFYFGYFCTKKDMGDVGNNGVHARLRAQATSMRRKA